MASPIRVRETIVNLHLVSEETEWQTKGGWRAVQKALEEIWGFGGSQVGPSGTVMRSMFCRTAPADTADGKEIKQDVKLARSEYPLVPVIPTLRGRALDQLLRAVSDWAQGSPAHRAESLDDVLAAAYVNYRFAQKHAGTSESWVNSADGRFTEQELLDMPPAQMELVKESVRLGGGDWNHFIRRTPEELAQRGPVSEDTVEMRTGDGTVIAKHVQQVHTSWPLRGVPQSALDLIMGKTAHYHEYIIADERLGDIPRQHPPHENACEDWEKFRAGVVKSNPHTYLQRKGEGPMGLQSHVHMPHEGSCEDYSAAHPDQEIDYPEGH